MKPSNACLSIIGMPASGKTTLGAGLAKATSRVFADSDQLFEAAHGMTIADFVLKNGWPAFRREEETIIERSIQPDTILSLGGGAIESEKTRELLVARTRILWIRAELQTIMQRFLGQQRGQERPQLTSLPLEQETREKFERRTPPFEGLAEIIVDAEESMERQIEHIPRIQVRS